MREIFAIAPEHELELLDARERTNGSNERYSKLYREHDSSQTTLALYRVWERTGLAPPHPREQGFEKLTIRGQLVDREVRYSRDDTEATDASALH